jgi:hypothetical protein
VIDNDSLALQRLIECLCPFGPTRILAQVVLIDSVWIPDAGTPSPRTAWTIASTRAFADDSAGADVEAKRVTDNESDATSGVIITDPWPSTVSVSGVDVSASAAGAKPSEISATTAAVRAYTGNPFDRAGRVRNLYAGTRPPSREDDSQAR